MKGLGARIRAKARELSMQDADLARAVGISPRRLSYYVTDDREPPLSLLKKIAAVLRTSCDELLAFRQDNGSRTDIDQEKQLLEDRMAALQAIDQDISSILARIRLRLSELEANGEGASDTPAAPDDRAPPSRAPAPKRRRSDDPNKVWVGGPPLSRDTPKK